MFHIKCLKFVYQYIGLTKTKLLDLKVFKRPTREALHYTSFASRSMGMARHELVTLVLKDTALKHRSVQNADCRLQTADRVQNAY